MPDHKGGQSQNGKLIVDELKPAEKEDDEKSDKSAFMSSYSDD